MVNEFDAIDVDEKIDDFDSPPSDFSKGDKELSPVDMEPSQFIRAPEIGQSVLLEVERVIKSDKTIGKNKATGEEFNIGVKNKKGEVTRIDIVCKMGRFTISNWEIYFKLFGVDGLLTKFGKKHKTFAGAQLKVTKNFNGQYSQMATKMVAKLMDKTEEDAEKYKAEVAKAMKERRLYTVELLNP